MPVRDKTRVRRSRRGAHRGLPMRRAQVSTPRAALLAGTSVLALLLGGHGAMARPFGSYGTSLGAPMIASDAASAAQQQAATVAKQSQNALARATQAIQALQAVQAAARNAAQGAGSSQTLPQLTVPNGLTPGGLQVAPGATTAGSGVWQNADLPTQTVVGAQALIDINQTAPKAILNWNTFNVGSQTTLTFDQHGNSGWVALNRVVGNLGPSQILGKIKADGQVYIINQNGIIFGGTSQVNVGSLIASTLGLSDQQFQKGIIYPQPYDVANQKPFDPAFANSSGAPAGDVTVEAGAVIQTAPPKSVTIGGGNVYLFGSNVTNSGTIITPDGQAVLAAGSAVYLTQSSDPNVRGVELNLLNGGTVTNTAQGYVSAPTGNISLVGMNIKQAGILSATTSVDEAGSISLVAHDGTNVQIVSSSNFTVTNYYVFPTRLGTVELSSGSLTAVLPDENGRTALDGQPQGQSIIRAEGQTINVLGGASIVAPSGAVALEASSNPVSVFLQDHPSAPGFFPNYAPDAGRVYVADGVTIDVSGLQNVAVSAADDVVQVNARANELRDSPLNRSGFLYGTNVWVNVHDLDKVAADQVYTAGGLLEVSGWLGLVQRTLDQRLTTGGTVSVFSTGDAILRPGASINIAGGSLDHQGGYVPDTRLIGADGRIYDINDAPANMAYVGIAGMFTVAHPHWNVTETYISPLGGRSVRYQAGYTEGKSAGNFTVAAHAAEIDAVVNATAVNGIYQRSPGSMAQNGTLTIGGGGGLLVPQDVVIAPTVAALADIFSGSTVIDGMRDPATLLPPDRQQTLYLSAKNLNATAYGGITITSGSGLTDPVTQLNSGGIRLVDGAVLHVADGGSISLSTAASISIDGQLVAHAGSVSFDTSLNTSATIRDVVFKPGSVVDVTGLWTNDLLDPTSTAPALTDGGQVTINAKGSVLIARGALIDASSGGWMQANGRLKLNANGLPVGAGGGIAIVSNYQVTGFDSVTPIVYSGHVTLDGTLRSQGLSGGGHLSIATSDIRIGGADPANGTTLWLDPVFFTQGGFNQYALISYNGMTVAPGADIELHTQTVTLTGAESLPTGASLRPVTVLGAPALFENAPPVNLVLSAVDPLTGSLTIGAGAHINTDPGATVKLHASRQLTIDGVIDAPGGTINLDLYGPHTSGANYPAAPYNSAQTLWIGADARLLAPGLIQTFVDATGQPGYRLWNGGSVNINWNGSDPDYSPYAAYLRPPSSNVGAPPPISPIPGENSGFDPLGTVVGQAGSVIDVSGAAGVILVSSHDGIVPSQAAIAVATNAGSVNILASQGLLLDSTLVAHGGGPTSAGGNLTIDQTMWAAPYNSVTYMEPVGELVLTQGLQSFVPIDLKPSDAIPGALQGQLHVSADRIMSGGFAAVSLGAVDVVMFNGDINLHTDRSLTINARAIAATPGANVQLTSAYVDIGGGQRNIGADFNLSAPSYVGGAAPLAGTANLGIRADLIDIEGNLNSGLSYSYDVVPGQTTVTVALPGFANMAFNSQGDIRLVPASPGGAFNRPSMLATLGNLYFTSAQIYPTTSPPTANAYSSEPNGLFEVAATGADSVITISSNGAATPAAPLSAGGNVQLIAPTINQGGVLRAPLGQITFGDPANPNTALNINLLPGSITSVSAAGLLIPYGSPLGNTDWTFGTDGPTPNTLSAPPSKAISFYGRSLTVAAATGGTAGAHIDEAGGGDFYGAQFVSGSGGSVDTLNGIETFAILPNLGSAYAPRDPLVSSNPVSASAPPVDLKVGEQVYLTGIPGLPSGNYTLLPGHYALLPGGYKLTVAVSQSAAIGSGNWEQPDGSYRVVGYGTVANTNIRDSLPSVFVVTPGSVVRTQSQYEETTAGQFFAAKAAANGVAAPRLPQDAGALVIDVSNSISFPTSGGFGDFSTMAGGRGGQVDVVASNLDILGPGGTAPAGFTGIQASALNAIGAQSLLIGGTRSLDGNVLTIVPTAQNLIVDNGAGLSAPEIMLAATTAIVVGAGARIDTTPFPAIPSQFPADPKTGQTLGSIKINGAGTLVVASNAGAVPITQGTGSTSTLTIGAGADIFAGSTLVLGASSDINVDASARFAAPTVTVSVPVINFGSGGASGFNLTGALLSQLSQGDQQNNLPPTANLILSASQAINVYGSVSLGDVATSTGRPLLAGLTLSSPVINGFGSATDVVRLTADKVTMLGGAGATASGSGQGTFVIDATQLTLGGGGILAFGGFSTVRLQATEQVIGGAAYVQSYGGETIGGISYTHGQVVPGTFSVTGDLVIASPIVTAQAGAMTQLDASSGAVIFAGLPGAPAATVASNGATLSVAAQTIFQGTDISLPSGAITFTAQHGITLAPGSNTSVAGAVTAFFDVVRISPAGSVTLQTANGDVTVAAGAVVDVRGGSLASVTLPYLSAADSDVGGNAGTLMIVAPNGTAHLGGTLLSGADARYTGGKAILNLGSGDAGTLLGNIAGFTGEQALSLASGDINLGNVTAQDIEFSASTGNLTVFGALDASGKNGGVIRLSAGGNLALLGSAVLDAHATANGGTGGSVFLGIDGESDGTLTLARQATINVSGNGAMGGEVWLRAPRSGPDGIRITNGGVTVLGAGKLIAEAVQVYDVSASPYVDANLVAGGAAVTDAASFMGNAAAVISTLGNIGNDPAFQLLPGIELRSNGDLTLLTQPSSGTGTPFAGSSYVYNDGIDLGGLRFNGAPGVLTLRAAGNLVMNGSLSDGFASPAISPDGVIFAIAPPSSGRSWGLRLVAGADLTAADPTAVVPALKLPAATAANAEPGSLIFSAPYLNDQNGIQIASVVRTGTGDLELAAAGNIDIQTAFGIYTAGQPKTPDFATPTRSYILSATTFTQDTYLGYQADGVTPFDATYPTALYPSYQAGGGNLTVKAQGSLIGGTTSSGYAATEIDTYWLWTEPTAASPTWFINFGTYYQSYVSYFSDSSPSVAAFQGLGALGGGNVKVSVGGDLTNVDVSLPTTGGMTSTGSTFTYGGGNLSMVVGGAINNANLYVGKGTADVRAGDIGSSQTSGGNPARVNLLIGDSQFTVVSNRNINALIGDPTRTVMQPDPLRSGAYPPPGLEGYVPANFSYNPNAAPYGFFTSFTSNSAISQLAEGGNITVSGDFVPPAIQIVAASGSISGGLLGFGSSGFGYVAALPASTARLDLLAAQNISSFGVSMTAADLTGEMAFSTTPLGSDYAGTLSNPLDMRATTSLVSNLVQFNDPYTVHVYAVGGDLSSFTLATSERAQIRAGLDIIKPLLNIENTAQGDVSLVQAGRDIKSCLSCSFTDVDAFNIRVEGPGAIDVMAGRNVIAQAGLYGTQGFGIATVGNADNPLLPSAGASINLMVGIGTVGPDIAAFISTYLDPANAASVLQSHTSDLVNYMRQRENNPNLVADRALADFRLLSPSEQLPLVEQVYFAELKAGGEAAANGQGAGGKGYDRAYKAIQTLFPGSTIGVPTTAYQGDLSLYQLARIRTEAGGDINILAPGGGVKLGIENQTPNLSGQVDTARPGLLTLRGGSINTYADGDVIVAQSRVFTELGGDILMFSTNGDLNAGKGKKTSLVTSPPQFTIDAYGNVTKSAVTPQTGAGIATLIGVPGVKPGNVDLFAPHGTIDAGDAGIRVSGNVTLAALQILNANNIQVQGTAVGVPTMQGPPVGALTSGNNTTGAASQQAALPPPASSNQPSVIIVEVMGYGGGDGSTPDAPANDQRRRNDGQQSYNPNSPFQIVGAGGPDARGQQYLTEDEKWRLGQ